MKKITLFLFLLFHLSFNAKSQSEIGLELGIHLSNYIPSNQGNTTASNILLNGRMLGGRMGLFYEKRISKLFNIRGNILYSFRYYNNLNAFVPNSHNNGLSTAYHKIHSIVLPFKLLLKLSDNLHLGAGLDLITLWGANVFAETNHFRLGFCGEIAYKIKKRIRLSIYCNYDFFNLETRHQQVYNNFIIGIGCAYILKHFKKRRVIYSPGI